MFSCLAAWWRHCRVSGTDLLGPPLKAEFIFHVTHDLRCFLYDSKYQASQEEAGQVLQAMLQVLLTWARNHGIMVQGEISNRGPQ